MVETIKSEEREALSVICMPRLSLTLLPRAQRIFAKRRPADIVQSSILRRNNIQRWAASRPFDVGLGMLPLDHQALTTEPLARVRAGVLVRNTHALAGQDEVTAADLMRTPCIGYLPGLMVREQVDQIFRDADLRPKFVSETTSTLLTCQLAVEGVGAAIIDCVAASQVLSQDNMSFIPLKPAVWWRIGAFRLRNRPRRNERFEEFVSASQQALKQIAAYGPAGVLETY